MNTFFFDDVQYPEGLFGGKDFFNPIIHSTEEREVGVWTDGRPLYQKTFLFNQQTSVPSETWYNTGFLMDNCMVVGEATAFHLDANSGASYEVTASLDNGTNQPIYLLNYRNAIINIHGFTIQYVKSTDVAGSAQYTTLGVPAHHYDGNEKVVGTWFGETLYEKTINTTVTPPYSSIDLSSLNIDEVIGFEGCAKSSGGDSIPIGYSVASGNQYLVASFKKATSTLYISLGSGLSDYNNVFLTIRYTKTS